MWFFKRRLLAEDLALLAAIAAGMTLKSHRELDGRKIYRLHHSDAAQPAVDIPFDQVQRLLDRGLLTTNQKFPAATFLLTSKGQKHSQAVRPAKGIAGVVRFDTKKERKS